MIRGLYAAASAAKAQEIRLATLLNNVANLETTGYKQDKVASRGFYEMVLARLSSSPSGMDDQQELGVLATGAASAVPVTDFSQGSLTDTGRPLDLALSGLGFFVVQTPDGVRYSRYGNLSTDADGRLTQPDGSPVLGMDGPIRLGPGTVQVDDAGNILLDGARVGQLSLVEIPEASLKKVGNNYFEALDAAAVQPARQTVVNQGFLENSNVDATRTMVQLMEMVRSYSAAEETVRLQDEVLGRSVGEIGRLA